MTLVSTGAFWKKEKDGKTFYSGIIEIEKLKIEDGKAQILLYKNDYKKEDKHPDLKILQVQDDQQENNTSPGYQNQPQEDPEDIPF